MDMATTQWIRTYCRKPSENFTVVMGHRWYNYLKADPDQDEKKLGLLNSDDGKCRDFFSFIVGWVNEKIFGGSTPRFAIFNNHLKFLIYMRKIPSDEWSFSEIIPGDKSHKLYDDIEVSIEKLPHHVIIECGGDVKEITKRLVDLAEKTAEECIRATIKYLHDKGITYSPDQVVFLTSHGKEKGSVHLIYQGIFVHTCEQGRLVSKKRLESLNPVYRQYVDEGMYKKNQGFRIPYSRKYGSDRVLMPKKTFSFEGKMVTSKIFVEMQRHQEKHDDKIHKVFYDNWLFERSLITTLPTENFLLQEPVEMKGPRSENEEIEDTLLGYLKWKAEQILEIPLKLRPRDSEGRYYLDRVERKKEMPCHLCGDGRTHANDGYLIFMNERGAFLRCNRGGKSTRLCGNKEKKEEEQGEKERQCVYVIKSKGQEGQCGTGARTGKLLKDKFYCTTHYKIMEKRSS